MAEMKIEYRRLEDIRPYENNPRRNEKAVEAVAESIKEFGFKNPIIIDRDGVIVSGHTRRLAAMMLGMEEVPVTVADNLTEKQIKAFRLADNRVAELATWDKKKLKEEIQKIIDIDMSSFGFDKKMLEDVTLETISIKNHVCPKCGHSWQEAV